jgi:HlyD family secretion protein
MLAEPDIVQSTAEHPPATLRTTTPPADKAVPRGESGPILQCAPRPRRKTGLAALVVAAIVIVAGLTWYALFRPVAVSVVPVESEVSEQVYGLGTVGARVQSNVGFKVAGVLWRLYADQGDRVKAGEALAQLDARDVAAQVAVAKAAVAQARANVEKAEADVASGKANLANAKAIAARRAALVGKGFATVEETQTTDAAARVAAATLVSAQAGVDVAKAALASAVAQEAYEEATLANYTLYAPYDAWIVSRNLELGSAVNPGQAVFTLVEAHSVWALGYVDERLAGRLGVGQPAEIALRSEPDKRYPGHVARIEIQSDPVNEERLVEVAFDQIPANIHLAEQAYVYITTGTLAHAVTVPQTIVTDFKGDRGAGGDGVVWTVEHGKLARREVTFGPELVDGRLPILDGLPPGAAVVAVPVSGMRVGRGVSIAQGPPP